VFQGGGVDEVEMVGKLARVRDARRRVRRGRTFRRRKGLRGLGVWNGGFKLVFVK